MPGQNSKTQKGTDQFRAIPGGTWKEFFGKTARNAEFGSPMPERARTWGEFGAGILKKSGVTSALLGGGLAFQEAVMPARRADAGIMLTGSDPAVYSADGAAQTVENGGSSMYTNFNYTFNNTPVSGMASGIGFNRNGQGWMLGAAHVDYVRTGLNGNILFGTGTNAQTNPGNQYSLANAFTYTPYTGPAIWQNAPDLTVFQLDRQLVRADGSLVGDIVFAPTRVQLGDALSWDGYGTRSFTDGTIFGPAGVAQSGLTEVSNVSGSSQFNAAYYFQTSLRPQPGSLAPDQSDSNAGLRDALGRYTGMYVAKGSNGLAFALDFTNSDVQNHINSVTSVPEPSSLALASIAISILAFARKSLRNKSKEIA